MIKSKIIKLKLLWPPHLCKILIKRIKKISFLKIILSCKTKMLFSTIKITVTEWALTNHQVWETKTGMRTWKISIKKYSGTAQSGAWFLNPEENRLIQKTIQVSILTKIVIFLGIMITIKLIEMKINHRVFFVFFVSPYMRSWCALNRDDENSKVMPLFGLMIWRMILKILSSRFWVKRMVI